MYNFKRVSDLLRILTWETHTQIGQNIFGRQPLKSLKGYSLFKQNISLQFFKGCLPQTLLGPLLNTLSQNKTEALTKSMYIWAIGTLNQLFM